MLKLQSPILNTSELAEESETYKYLKGIFSSQTS